MPAPSSQNLFTVPEAAAYLDCAANTIHRAIDGRELAILENGPRRTRLITRDELDRFRRARGEIRRGRPPKKSRAKSSRAVAAATR